MFGGMIAGCVVRGVGGCGDGGVGVVVVDHGVAVVEVGVGVVVGFGGCGDMCVAGVVGVVVDEGGVVRWWCYVCCWWYYRCWVWWMCCYSWYCW